MEPLDWIAVEKAWGLGCSGESLGVGCLEWKCGCKAAGFFSNLVLLILNSRL